MKHYQQSKKWIENVHRTSTTAHHQVNIERERGAVCNIYMYVLTFLLYLPHILVHVKTSGNLARGLLI